MSSKVVTDAFTLYAIDSDDARHEILEGCGDLSAVPVWGSDVLVGVFCRPVVTPNGIFTGSNVSMEDVWQGKVGMILKLGPAAFPESDATYGGRKPQVGDWVWHNVNQTIAQVWIAAPGWKNRVFKTDRAGKLDPNGANEEEARPWKGWPCRFVDDSELRGLERPEVLL